MRGRGTDLHDTALDFVVFCDESALNNGSGSGRAGTNVVFPDSASIQEHKPYERLGGAIWVFALLVVTALVEATGEFVAKCRAHVRYPGGQFVT
jgi:hypothetical protein